MDLYDPQNQTNPYYDYKGWANNTGFTDNPSREDGTLDRTWSATTLIAQETAPRTVTLWQGVTWGWQNYLLDTHNGNGPMGPSIARPVQGSHFSKSVEFAILSTPVSCFQLQIEGNAKFVQTIEMQSNDLQPTAPTAQNSVSVKDVIVMPMTHFVTNSVFLDTDLTLTPDSLQLETL